MVDTTHFGEEVITPTIHFGVQITFMDHLPLDIITHISLDTELVSDSLFTLTSMEVEAGITHITTIHTGNIISDKMWLIIMAEEEPIVIAQIEMQQLEMPLT